MTEIYGYLKPVISPEMTEGRLTILTSSPNAYDVKVSGRGWRKLKDIEPNQPLAPDMPITIFKSGYAIELYALNTGDQTYRCTIYDEDTWNGQKTTIRFIKKDEYVWMGLRDVKMKVEVVENE